MIKKIFFFILFPLISFSQNTDKLFKESGEIYFSFKYESKNQLNELSKIISLDHKTNSFKSICFKQERI